MKKVSIIITTYNWPAALDLVLQSLACQTVNDFEVIIADDGSTQQTNDFIIMAQQKYHYPIKHVWQTDEGFQAAKIRNKAVAASSGEYLIFLDGDSVVRTNFVARHLLLAEKSHFVFGNRVLLSQQFTQQVLQQNIPIYNWSNWQWFVARCRGKINRFISLLSINSTLIQNVGKHSWQGVKTCNLAIWKSDFISVNGLDESYVGWGYEDSDLVVRLLRKGLLRKSGKFFIPVLHLWHNEFSRSQQAENYQRLEQIQQSTRIYASKGVDQY